MRKKKEEDHDNLERWLITYSDLITLLLAFFIMMYTFSKQDAQKYQEVSEYLRAIFSGGTAILKTGASGRIQACHSATEGGFGHPRGREAIAKRDSGHGRGHGPGAQDICPQR